MILAFIFIIGCFVTAIVAVGLMFAMAATGFEGKGGESGATMASPDPPPVGPPEN